MNPTAEYTQDNEASDNLSHEKVQLRSGQLLIIDQFMLGNEQFLELITPALSGSITDLAAAAATYGGVATELPAGDYFVYRQLSQTVLCVVPEAASAEIEMILEDAISVTQAENAVGRVFIDTRCLVFCDVTLLQNEKLMEEYRALRLRLRDKNARDLLRDNGAAIRYGFNRDGDELAIANLPGSNGLIAWPDVVEPELH